MASRREALRRPLTSGLRRSARLQGVEAPPVADSKVLESRITKSKPTAKADNAKRRDCDSCFRNLSKSSFPKHITHGCEHPVATCKACLKAWILAQLESTTYDNLSCPECPQILQNADVEKNATKAVYERFDQLERRGIADSTPGWRWCLNPHCRAGQIHEPSLLVSVDVIRKRTKVKAKEAPGDDICECQECHAKACVPCDRPYHEGETCEEYQKRLKKFEADEKATLKTIRKVCKECPRCAKNIQKNGGCDHMRCTQCSTSFCFLCLKDYNTINKHGHGEGCTYARPGAIDPHAIPIGNN